MNNVNKTTVVSVVLGMAIFGGLIYIANRSGVAALQSAASVVNQ